MKVVPDSCPACKGNLVVAEFGMSLVCEDCGHSESDSDKALWLHIVTELSEEWGPKAKRVPLSSFSIPGKIILEAYQRGGLPMHWAPFGQTLDEMRKGIESEDDWWGDEEIRELVIKWGLVNARKHKKTK